MRQRVHERTAQGKDVAVQTAAQDQEYLRVWQTQLEQQVWENPLLSLVLAAGLASYWACSSGGRPLRAGLSLLSTRGGMVHFGTSMASFPKESIMADSHSQPKKVGQYERPARTGRVGVVIGVLVLIALIILAILLF